MTAPILRSSVVALAITLTLTACGGDDSVGVADITSVAVTPGATTLVSLGATQQLAASASAGGAAVADVTFTWSSSDASVASVSASGLVTAVANGTATMTASAVGGTASGTATITVAQAVATITLTIADETVTPGSTTQVTATVVDAGGSDLANPNLTWSSSDPTIATVDNTGLVTGVLEGQVVITALQDGVSGTVGAEVMRPDLVIEADQVIGGALTVGTMSVAAGVTVTLMEDTEINANGPVTIAGEVIGDCLGLSLTGQDAVTISGTFSNACSDLPGTEDPPALTITGNAVVNLDGAMITSSGDISISNVPPSLKGESAHRSAAQTAKMEPMLSLAGSTVQHQPPAASDGADVVQEDTEIDPDMVIEGGDGEHGKSIEFHALELIFMDGATFVAQDGGDGGSVILSSSALGAPPLARGGDGGGGGDIDVVWSGDGTGGSIQGTPIRIEGGDGGEGGDATALGLPNPSEEPAPGASAEGGEGGDGGEADASFGIDDDDGRAGNGGDATATGARGADATPTRLAQQGGSATAVGGDGGDGDSGDGGEATAMPGDGGDGEPVVLRDGAAGGDASAEGGDRGDGSSEGGDTAVSGGNGGNGASACFANPPLSLIGFLYVLSDPAFSDAFIFNAGSAPGIAFAIVLLLLERGGDGGDGGTIVKSVPGRSADLGSIAGPGFNGGDAGAGSPVGTPGGPGSIAGDNPTINQMIPDLFQPGQTAGACSGSTSTPTSAIVATISPATAGAVDRGITLTGAAPWINVTGTVAESGTVTASGRGVMNGTPNILVRFNGTFDEAAGTLVGTYSMDPEKIISAQHPLVYSIDVSVPAQSSAGRSGENR